jgi:hypothetical protein
MDDNAVVVIVFLVLGGIVGVWGFFRFPTPALLVNYPTLIVSYAVKFIPALAVLMGAQTTIQQEPVRKPDDHLASQSQHGEVILEGAALELWASTTGGDLSVPLTGSEISAEQGSVFPPRTPPQTT